MAKDRKMLGRITYDPDWHGEGEHYVFEWKFEDEGPEGWRFECAAGLHNFGEYKDMIHYTALTKIREWNRLGIREILWR